LAQERFLPAGPFAVLPMTGNRSSLVWAEPTDQANVYLELPEEEFLQEISERVGGYLGKIISSDTRFSYPLSLLHAKKYTAERVVLIGDAAHGMHPIAGQGVNLGFRDVAVLSALISKNFVLGLDIGGAGLLSEYESLRKCDSIIMLAGMDILNRLFCNNTLPVRAARDVGLWAVGKMPPLKRFFMRHAMGLVYKMPS
jgi:2-octaprenyl-6-methoxyphenol hydroxylase